MGEGIAGALVVLVPAFGAVLLYLGTRGSTRVNQQAALDAKSDKLIDQLQEERDGLKQDLTARDAEIVRLHRVIASIEQRRSPRTQA